MMSSSRFGTWSLIVLLGASAVGACSGDDDDDTNNVAGRAGASHAGTTNGGSSVTEGGTTGVSGHSGSTSTGGSLPSIGGAPADGGAEQGGDAGVGGDMGGMGGAGEGGAAGAGGDAAIAALSDAQILLVLDTLNQGEVEEAYAALPRLSAGDVKAFAQMMVTDHGNARQTVATTAEALNAAPMPSETQAKLHAEAEVHVALLRATSSAALDATYMDLEVEGHAEALKLLDELAPAANAAQLATLIATLRATVQQHYEDAQQIQSAL